MGTEQQNSLEAECGESGSSWFHEEADGGCGQQGHWESFESWCQELLINLLES